MITLTPAYGRDYKSKKAAIEDFQADKDFIYNEFSSPWDGKYCNKTDLQNAGVHTVNIRYKNLTQICNVKVK